ncbi:hypothetical protein RchiOBHm_Chr3g0470771 [Rosa chinensis]|uniref:Uncharacterized protein n=1 Tax=Rosa chinensis TaxID=74649 RepID=A0A2P6RB43_ROSCH|nr:hypothetical protein RchiOBHm_Chr3g0470771 [Rosa chinensis]
MHQVAAVLRILACAYLLMFTFFWTPRIPQLMGGTPLQRELARIWGVTNLILMFDILRNILIFAYYIVNMLLIYIINMPLLIRNSRRIICFLCLWGAISLALYISN